MNYSVDTNIFLRFLQQDDPQKAERVKKIFGQAQIGKQHLIVEPFIIIELTYALSSYFKLPKSEICQKNSQHLDSLFSGYTRQKRII